MTRVNTRLTPTNHRERAAMLDGGLVGADIESVRSILTPGRGCSVKLPRWGPPVRNILDSSDVFGAEAFDADGALNADDADRSIVGRAFLLVTEDVAGGDEFAGALDGIGRG